MADAIAKFWIMPRTGTASAPVDSSATGVTPIKGFDLARDLLGGLPELDDQIGGAMVGQSGQPRAEHVSTIVRELQPFSVEFRDNKDPHAVAPARVGAGTIFTRKKILTDRGENAAPYRVEIEYETGNTVSFDMQFGNRKTIPAELSLELEFKPTGDVIYAP